MEKRAQSILTACHEPRYVSNGLKFVFLWFLWPNPSVCVDTTSLMLQDASKIGFMIQNKINFEISKFFTTIEDHNFSLNKYLLPLSFNLNV